MKTKIGILYCIENVKAWDNYKKCGRTTQTMKKRLSNLQTSLIDNCTVIYTTDVLLDCYFYEYILKKILKDYRVRRDREFYDIEPDEIKDIYKSFSSINSILNTEEKLNEYIKNNHPKYFRLSKKDYILKCVHHIVLILQIKKNLKKEEYCMWIQVIKVKILINKK